jgi:hypothetical protein
MTGEFEGFLSPALRDLREAGIPAPQELTDEQRHLPGLLGVIGGPDPGAGLTAEQRRLMGLAYIDVGDGVHGFDPAPPVPFRRRARYALRRSWWWVTGLRVAHRSRIDQDGDG